VDGGAAFAKGRQIAGNSMSNISARISAANLRERPISSFYHATTEEAVISN
jgi:hypothetical protein